MYYNFYFSAPSIKYIAQMQNKFPQKVQIVNIDKKRSNRVYSAYLAKKNKEKQKQHEIGILRQNIGRFSSMFYKNLLFLYDVIQDNINIFRGKVQNNPHLYLLGAVGIMIFVVSMRIINIIVKKKKNDLENINIVIADLANGDRVEEEKAYSRINQWIHIVHKDTNGQN